MGLQVDQKTIKYLTVLCVESSCIHEERGNQYFGVNLMSN